jgi:hypothetical protein
MYFFKLCDRTPYFYVTLSKGWELTLKNSAMGVSDFSRSASSEKRDSNG